MSFTLTKNQAAFEFDLDGNVSAAGAPAGKWSVNTNNQIELAKADGSTDAFDVGWSFIDNQLWLISAGAKTFNFHSAGFPDYSVDKSNRIVVAPSSANTKFTFALSAELSINATMDLVVRVGDIETAIDGVLESPSGIFAYRFTDPALGVQDTLTFAGEWVRNEEVDGDLHLKFAYKLNGAAKAMAVPVGFDVNPIGNGLRLRYEKKGAVRTLQLQGGIKFKNNSTLAFVVRRSGGAGSTEIEVAVRLNGTGKTIKTLELLVLRKADADGTKVLTIGGTLAASVGANGSLSLNFRYAAQSGGPASAKVDVAVNGTFQMKGATIVFSYKKDGSTTKYSVVARDVRIGASNVTVGFDKNGQTITAFLGVTW